MIEELVEVAAFPKHPGVHTVLRLVRVDGTVFMDIRDRVTVDGQTVWGRGYLLPAEAGGQFAAAADQAAALAESGRWDG